MLLSYKPLHLEAQQRLQKEGCVVDIKLFSGAIAREARKAALTPRQLSSFLASLPGRLTLEDSMDYGIRSGKSLSLGMPKAPQGKIQGQPKA